MKLIVTLTCATLLSFVTTAQTVATIPSATYPTIQSAVTAMNTSVPAGGVIFNIAPDYIENTTGPIILSANSSAANPLVFRRDPSIVAGNNPRIQVNWVGTTTTATTALNTPLDGIFKINGSDYVTIDALDLSDNAANTTNITSMEYGYGLFKPATNNGCDNVIIQNCTITLNKENRTNGLTEASDGSTGIWMANTPHNQNSTVGVNNATGRHTNNIFRGNTIRDCHTGIYLKGYSNFVDINNVVGANSLALGNKIFNFGGTTAENFSPAMGIRIAYQNDVQILFNEIDNNRLPGGVDHPGNIRGIFTEVGNNANITIEGNEIELTGTTGSNGIKGIESSAGSAGSSNIVRIVNNKIKNCVINGILSSSAIENNGNPDSLQIQGNEIFNNSSTGANQEFIGIEISGATGTNAGIYNNTIRDNFKTNTGGSLSAIQFYSGDNIYCHDNNIHSNYYNFSGASGLTGLIQGIDAQTGSGTSSHILNNHLHNLYFTVNLTGGTASVSIYGIRSLEVRPTKNIIGNEFNNFRFNYSGFASNSHSVAMYGIFASSGNPLTVSHNKVYDMVASRGSSNLTGIHTQVGTNVYLHNNIVGDLHTPDATGTNALQGIQALGNPGETIRIYYNTVYLNCNNTSATSFGSSALFTGTSATIDLRNNILINTSNPGPTGNSQTVAYRRNLNSFTNYHPDSDNNLYYVAAAVTPKYFVYHDGTNACQTLACFKTLVSPRDDFSISELPVFHSVSSSDPLYLHIPNGTVTNVESGGQVLAGYPLDYDLQTRFGSPGYSGTSTVGTDIGADEFDGTSNITCYPPGTPDTSGLTHNAVSVAWTAGTFAVSYDWELRVGNSCSSGAIAQSGNTGGLSLNLSGLTGNTTYTFCIKSNCGASGVSTTSSITFTTSCTPLSIWTENFDGMGTVGDNDLPPCWVEQNGTWRTGNAGVTFSTDPRSAPNYLMHFGNANNTWMWTAPLQLTAGVSYDFSFWYQADGLGDWTIDVAWNTVRNSAGATILGASTVHDDMGGEIQPFPYILSRRSFTPTQTGTYYFGIKLLSSGGSSIGFDDFKLEVTPSCQVPENILLNNMTGTTADASWSAVTGAVSYDYAITTSLATPVSFTNTTSTSVSISGLNPITTYYLHVRANCGSGSGEWRYGIPVRTTLDCAAAVTIASCNPASPTNVNIGTGSGGYNASYTFATNSGLCTGGKPGMERLFTFTPAVSGVHRLKIVSVPRAGSLTYMWKLASAGCGPTGWNCIGNLNNPRTEDIGNLTAGVPIFILIDPGSLSGGEQNFEIECPVAVVPNDECTNAITVAVQPYALSCNTSTSASTDGATESAQPVFGCVGAGYNDDIWYIFTATQTSQVFRYSNLVPGTGAPTSLGYIVYSNTCSPTSQIVCGNSFGNPSGGSSTITGLTPGTTYLLRLFTTGNTTSGSFEFCLQDPAPANDECATATLVTVGGATLTNQTTDLATQSVGPITCNAKTSSNANDVWYRFVATASIATINITGSGNFDAVAEFFNGCGSLTAACSDATGAGGTETFTVTGLFPGQIYSFRVYEFNHDAPGNPFSVQITSPAIAPGTPGTCEAEPGLTINLANNNTARYNAILDASGRLVADIYPAGQQLGNVTGSLYVNAGPIRRDAANRAYLDRNLEIRTQNAPTGNISYRIYIRAAEVNALIADGSISSVNDLDVFISDEPCSGGITGTAQRVSATVGNYGSDFALVFATELRGSIFIASESFSILPIHLVSFSGERRGNINVLKWKTSSEEKSNGFYVERSTDGINYNSVGFVKSLAPGGNSNSTLNYQFSDNSASTIKQFYRLRFVDVDDRSSYSKVIWINSETTSVISITGIFPNPVKKNLTVMALSPKKQTVTAVITDISGLVISTRKLQLEKGSNNVELNVSSLSGGSYLLKMVCAEGCEQSVARFVKF